MGKNILNMTSQNLFQLADEKIGGIENFWGVMEKALQQMDQSELAQDFYREFFQKIAVLKAVLYELRRRVKTSKPNGENKKF